jgi:RHS repeat-associated protein
MNLGGNSSFLSEKYRYGFQNQEKDDEVKGEGNSYDFGARMYDSRLGRWLSIDSKAGKYPSLSPYSFVANSPILFIDPDGKDIEFPSIQKGEDGIIIIEMKITAKIVNESIWPVLNEVHMKDLVDRGSAALKEIYGITGDNIEVIDDFGNEISGNFKVNVIVELSAASDSNPVTDKDHVIYIASHGSIPHSKDDAKKTGLEFAGKTVLGYTPDNYKLIYITNKILNIKPLRDENGKMIDGRDSNGDDSFERTLSHEIGHTGGLPHAEDSSFKTTLDNLMREGREVKRGIKLEPIQMEILIEESRSGSSNSGSNKLD